MEVQQPNNRILQGFRPILGQNNIIIPKWVSSYAIGFYIAALLVVTFMFSSYAMPWYYLLSGIASILAFFLWGQYQYDKWNIYKVRKEKNYEKNLFIVSLIPRLVWTILIYYLFMQNYGDAFGFENGDATFYDYQGQLFSQSIKDGNFFSQWQKTSEFIDISDLGYSAYVGFVYWLTDNSIIAVRLLKCVLSAYTVLLTYRLVKRNFGVQTARIAAIFVALWPNFWYYCGTHLKEVEMVFLTMLFVDQAEQMLRSRQFTAWKIIPILLIAAAMFTFRTPLGIVALLALVFSVVMSSTKVVSWGKRIIVGALAIALIGVVAGNRIQEQTQSLLETARSQDQKSNMEWRSERKGGNAFAKYAGSAIFAPMIFTLPFPTMASVEGQDVQQLLNGGNFVKNIMSFFVLVAMFTLLLSGKWRDHLLPLSFMLGYLVVLSLSNFAQSERFHQPALPFELMFAAYGLSVAVTKKKYKRWFTYWCVLMFVAAIVWNWFKLAGRGLA